MHSITAGFHFCFTQVPLLLRSSSIKLSEYKLGEVVTPVLNPLSSPLLNQTPSNPFSPTHLPCIICIVYAQVVWVSYLLLASELGALPATPTVRHVQNAMHSLSLLSHCPLHVNTKAHISQSITLIFLLTSLATACHCNMQPCSTFLLHPSRLFKLCLCFSAGVFRCTHR